MSFEQSLYEYIFRAVIVAILLCILSVVHGIKSVLVNKKARREEYYKYQVYNPEDPTSDRLGYVHFATKEQMQEYKKRTGTFGS